MAEYWISADCIFSLFLFNFKTLELNFENKTPLKVKMSSLLSGLAEEKLVKLQQQIQNNLVGWVPKEPRCESLNEHV